MKFDSGRPGKKKSSQQLAVVRVTRRSLIPAGLAVTSMSEISARANPTGLGWPQPVSDQTKAVWAAAQALGKAFATADFDTIAKLHAVDAIAIYPIKEPKVGREAIREQWVHYYNDPPFHGPETRTHPVTVDDVRADEKLAFSFGKWWVGKPPGRAEDEEAGGYYIAQWELKTERDGWNVQRFVAGLMTAKPSH